MTKGGFEDANPSSYGVGISIPFCGIEDGEPCETEWWNFVSAYGRGGMKKRTNDMNANLLCMQGAG